MNRLNRYISEIITSADKRTFRHLLLQILLLLITSSVLWTPGSESMPDGRRIVVWLLYYVTVNILVYLNIYVLVRKLLLRNRVGVYMIWVFTMVLIFVLVIGLLQTLLPQGHEQVTNASAAIGIISSLAAVGLLFAGTSALVLFRQWIMSGRRRMELESLNLTAELQMLKNQINPHFLFNMLNNCYLLIKKKRKEAPEVILRLVELLRYQMECVTYEKVSLEQEITFLSDLLNLEKIRRDQFHFSIEDRTEGSVYLPPLILIPFVENAIKHNSDSENLSYVEIVFECWQKGLIFTCTNSKPVVRPAVKGTGGLGLKNIGRRLELLFPSRHELCLFEDDIKYSVTLKLEL